MNIKAVIESQRAFFSQGKSKDLTFRREMLDTLLSLIKKNESKIEEALYADLGKSSFEAYTTEIGLLYEEIRYHKKRMKRWSRARRVGTNQMIHAFSKSKIYPQPRGNALIISPWNYPFQLSIMPLIAAISSGCTAIIKPSELSQHTSALLNSMMEEAFPREYICVCTGESEVSKELLTYPFDIIFFTGSPQVGKIVMTAAAEHLCPVVLELGGKSPVLIMDDANINKAARRIAWGKLLNAGQTCIAPDYVLISKKNSAVFADAVRKNWLEFWGEEVCEHPHYPCIISEKHYARLKSYLEINCSKISLGSHNDSLRRLAPTLLINPSSDHPVMKEEIFGPILPIIEIENLQEGIDFINARPRPLALYLFGNDKSLRKKVLSETHSGGVAINDVIMHVANNKLPFGGIGNSGIGNYHGKFGFEAFSHYKSVIQKLNFPEPPIRYMPYGEKKLSFIKRILK